MVAEKNPEIRKAVETLYELSADEKVRAEYEARQKAWRDRMSGLEDAKQEGMEESKKYILGLINQGISLDELRQKLDV